MKKVGILVNSIGYGGNERSAVNIAKAIEGTCDPTIIIQEDCGNHYNYNGHVINMNTPCANTKVGKVLNSIRRILILNKIIKQEHIETLVIILPVTNPINYLTLRCKKIVSCRDCGDLIKRTGRYIKMTRSSDLIVCNSIEQSELLAKAAPDIEKKIKVIYNIIDIVKVTTLMNESVDDTTASFMRDHKCIVSTGRFANAKGWNNLIKTFSILAKKREDVRLIIIGDGELRERINELIENLDVAGKVLLPGFQENPFKIISKSQVFILSSFYEGFPNVLIEAMNCGVPVIATNCPSGPAEILQGSVKDGYSITEYGILFAGLAENESNWNADDIRQEHVNLSEIIDELLNNTELSTDLSNHAMKRVSDFTAEKIKNNWIDIL